MGDNSNGPGCAGGCGILLVIAIVATILKAIYDAVSSLVAAVVAAITTAVTALGLAALGSFSVVVTLAMAWFVVFKLNPRGERSELSGAHAGLLAGTGVAGSGPWTRAAKIHVGPRPTSDALGAGAGVSGVFAKMP